MKHVILLVVLFGKIQLIPKRTYIFFKNSQHFDLIVFSAIVSCVDKVMMKIQNTIVLKASRICFIEHEIQELKLSEDHEENFR